MGEPWTLENLFEHLERDGSDEARHVAEVLRKATESVPEGLIGARDHAQRVIAHLKELRLHADFAIKYIHQLMHQYERGVGG